MDSATSLDSLLQDLLHKKPDKRWDAAVKLGEMGRHATAAIPALQSATSDKDAMVRQAAQEALIKLRDDREIPKQTSAISSQNSDRDSAVHAEITHTHPVPGSARSDRFFALVFDNMFASLLSMTVLLMIPNTQDVLRGIALVVVYLGYFFIFEGLVGSSP